MQSSGGASQKLHVLLVEDECLIAAAAQTAGEGARGLSL